MELHGDSGAFQGWSRGSQGVTWALHGEFHGRFMGTAFQMCSRRFFGGVVYERARDISGFLGVLRGFREFQQISRSLLVYSRGFQERSKGFTFREFPVRSRDVPNGFRNV